MESILTKGAWFPFTKIDNAVMMDGRLTQKVRANHLEPGLVSYENMGEGGKDLVLFLPKETIDRMRAKFAGHVVVNGSHRDLDQTALRRGEADGVVWDSFWDGSTGKEMVDYMVWTDEARGNVAKPDWGVSCSYTVTQIDRTAGTHNNIPYDGTILDGEYNHLAIVPNPRYEDSRNTLLNEKKGGRNVIKVWLEKLGIRNSVEVKPEEQSTKLKNGKTVTLKEMVDFAMREDNHVLADEAEIELPNGKKMTVAELRNKMDEKECPCGKHDGMEEHNAAMKNAKEEEEKELKEKEAKNAADEKEKKEKEEKEKAENAQKQKLENERKEKERVENEKAKELEKIARERGSLENSTPSFMSNGDALSRGRELFGSDRAASREKVAA